MHKSIFALLLAPQILFASAVDFQRPEHEGTVAWAALVKPGKEAALATAVAKFGKAQSVALSAAGVGGLSFYTERMGEQTCVIATHNLLTGAKPDANWVEIARGNSESARWLDEMEACINPHPRLAASGGAGGRPPLWARCETICQLRPEPRPVAPKHETTYVAITELRPEKEAEYRDLHSHVWPGVIAAIGDSGISRFDLYLIEFSDTLYLVYSFDYRGTDFDGDMAKMAANPVNKRWWKFTDTCQKALPQTAKGIWEPMEPVAVPAKDTVAKDTK